MMFELAQAVRVLESTPGTLSALLAQLGPPWTHRSEGEGTWTPFDIVGHLIHGERTDWWVRVQHILQLEERPFEPFDREAQFVASQGLSLKDLLQTFSELRGENLEQLASLNIGEAQLQLRGEHPSLGTVTLRQLRSTWVVHDLSHLAQIARVMAKQYREEVGPWAAFLPLLSVESQRGE